MVGWSRRHAYARGGGEAPTWVIALMLLGPLALAVAALVVFTVYR